MSWGKSHQFSKSWPEHWRMAFEKWEEALRKTRNRSPFDHPGGWHGFKIVSRCGYCWEFGIGNSCDQCPLFKDKTCRRELSWWRKRNNTFWDYILTMQEISRIGWARENAPNTHHSREKIDRLWNHAILMAKKMLRRIEQDKPEDA